MKHLIPLLLIAISTTTTAWERTHIDPDGFGGYRYRTWSTEGSGYTWGNVQREPDGGYTVERFGDLPRGIWDRYYEEEMLRMLED